MDAHVDDYRAASLQGWSSVAGDWADLIERIDRQLAPAADWMLQALELAPGDRVLELAGGPGTLSLLAARAVGPEGRVIYSDFAEPMVYAARERLRSEQLPGVECLVLDAEAIDLPDGSVDAAMCRMGYMLMPDHAAALRETARVLGPGGRLALAVWAHESANPWVALPMQAVAAQLGLPPAPADAPGLWSLAEEDRLRGALTGAGFGELRIDALDGAAKYESAEQWIEMTRRLAGPLRALLASLDEDSRHTIEEGMREQARPYEHPGGDITMPQRMLVASARASA